MKNWQTKKLGEICDFQGGSQPPKSNFIFSSKKGYIRFLQIRDFASDKHITYIPESKKNRLCKKDDILLGRYGASVGKILINKEGAYNVAVMKTKPDLNLIHKKYFYYYLVSDEFQRPLSKVAARSAQAGFSKDDIYNFPILTPPLYEQERIVKKLGEIFENIDKAKENTEKNLQNSKELFESYLLNVFNKAKKGWHLEKLGEVCKFQGGSQPSKVDFVYHDAEGYIRMLQIRDYKTDKHIVYIPTNKAKRFCKKDDVMIGRYGPPLFQILRGFEGAYNVALMKAIPDENKLDKDYLYFFLKNPKIQSYVISLSSRAAGQTGLNKETLEAYPINYPKLADQKQIVTKIRLLSEQKT